VEGVWRVSGGCVEGVRFNYSEGRGTRLNFEVDSSPHRGLAHQARRERPPAP